jgi:hypothetical protein
VKAVKRLLKYAAKIYAPPLQRQREEAMTNAWTETLKERDETIEKLKEENTTIKRDLGYYRSAFKLLAYSVRLHLGIKLI